MKLTSRLMTFLIVAALMTASAFAQSGSVSGKVLDKDGKPLVGATMSIDRKAIAGHYEVKTDAKGAFFHAGLPTGQYKITVMVNGVGATFADNVRVTFGGTTPVDFDLSQAPQAAPTGISAEEQARVDAAKKSEEDTKNAFNNGLAALAAKQYDEAVRLLKEASEKDATQAVIFAQLGEAYSGAKKYDDAVAAYNKAIELKPDEYGYYNNIGIAYGNAGKIDEAIKSLQKAGEINPALAPQAYFNLGAILTNRGRSKDAVEMFKKAIELKPDMSQAYLQLGISYFSSPTTMGDAVTNLEKFLTMNPNPTDKETATQLISAAKAAGGGNSSFKSEAQIAKEKAAAEKAEKDKTSKAQKGKTKP